MAKLAIIGSGVVGQATGKGFSLQGHDVVFTDINPLTLSGLQEEGYGVCTPSELARENIKAFFLTVSTPTVNGRIELNFIRSAAAELGITLKKAGNYRLVVVRSTVPPGTTENEIIPIIEKKSGKKAGRDFGVCMNPEFLREGSNERDFQNPWIIVIGELDKTSGEMLKNIYLENQEYIIGESEQRPRDSFRGLPDFGGRHQEAVPKSDLIYFTSIREAEMEKYVHNLYNAAKISFFNEMRSVCKKLEINADTVFGLVAKSAEASWNEKYGLRDMGAFGGSCLPKDTSAFLSWAKDETNSDLAMLKAVIDVNESVKKQS